MIKSEKIKSISFFFVFLLTLLFSFRSLILNISTNLIDWYDYPFVVWVFSQNIDHFLAFDLSNIFESNILYPYKSTLLLSENFIVPSLIATPFFIFTKNLILSFNLQLLINFILNYLASFLLWKLYFKNSIIAFLGSLLVVYSPIFHFEMSHYQMQIIWPFLFCLYFVKKSEDKSNKRYIFLSGLFLAVQFLSNLYFSVFLALSLFIYYFIEFVITNKKQETIKRLIMTYLVFLLLASPFIYGHLKANKEVAVTRSYSESVQYSSHLSDYLFTNSINSLIHSSRIVDTWNKFNNHPLATFPGLFVFFTALFSLGKLSLKATSISFISTLSRNKIFFVSLLLIGFIFSLGPRLNVNGVFTGIPLPYDPIVKLIPFVDSLRVTTRWSLLFYLGMIFLSLSFLKNLKLKPLSFTLVFIILLLEYIPINLKTDRQVFVRQRDYVLQSLCQESLKVVLEIPVTHYGSGTNIAEGLNYISKTQLASTYHKCKLVNGYTSYDLPSLSTLEGDLTQAVLNSDTKKVYVLFTSTQADIISLNEIALPNSYKEKYKNTMETLVQEGKLKTLDEQLYELTTNEKAI